MLLFVYGTLMKGEKNHHMMRKAEYVGDASLPHAYLVHLGGFPGLMFQHATDTTSKRVKGEVYKVTLELLHALDVFEGVPHLYDRIEAYTEDGTKVYVYEYQGNENDYHIIAEGDWKQYK